MRLAAYSAGIDQLALRSPDGSLEAMVVPGANMVIASLRDRGVELLGLRGGLAAYVERGSSFGVPLLHPWANRLGDLAYAGVDLRGMGAPLKLDGNGLPMHGLLTASPSWELIGAAEERVEARFAFDSPELLAAFPYPHELGLEIALAPGELRVTTVLRATGDAAVPIAFGWHPYLTLPGTPRARWRVELPVRTHAVLDGRGIPTGETERVTERAGEVLGDRAFDHLYLGIEEGAAFSVADADRRIEVGFEAGYPVAQVYAPAGEDFICFEPMTAPTNALISGDGLRTVGPSEAFEARFSVRVGAAPGRG